MSDFSLHDVVRFRVDGAGRLPDYMRMQFADFALPETKPDFTLQIGGRPASTEPAIRLKGDSGDYLRAGSTFSIRHGGEQLALDGSSPFASLSALHADANFPRMELNRLLELRFRFPMAAAGSLLVHASAVTQGDRCVAFPAWKSTGKTALCLTLLGRGHGFLSDDRLWLRRDGHVLAYPRYLVVNASNAGDFPELLGASDRWVHAFHRALDRLGLPGLAQRVVRRFLPAPVRYFPLNALFPDAPTPSSAKLEAVLFVIRAAEPRTGTKPEVREEALPTDQMSQLIRAVGDFEWNAELISMAAAHDVLFPEGPSWGSEISALIQTEAALLGEALTTADCARLALPTSGGVVDWAEVADAVEARSSGD